jgi:hypothetical protein
MMECPFCGSVGEIEQFIEESSGNLGTGTNITLPWSRTKIWYRPKCSKCDCVVDNGFSTPEGATKEWNDRRTVAIGWLKKAAQMAEQQARGGNDAPLHTAWHWLHDNIKAYLSEI